ncbi:MAG: hypothetical protein WC485_01445 [Opitutaceae bacterium]
MPASHPLLHQFGAVFPTGGSSVVEKSFIEPDGIMQLKRALFNLSWSNRGRPFVQLKSGQSAGGARRPGDLERRARQILGFGESGPLFSPPDPVPEAAGGKTGDFSGRGVVRRHRP